MSKAKEMKAHLKAGRAALEKGDHSVALRHAGLAAILQRIPF
jgi:hypothetical protein